MKEYKRVVLDTSVLISQYFSKNIEEGNVFVEEIIIPAVALSELQNQANKGYEKGIIGLKEVQKLRELSEKNKFNVIILGERPKLEDIKLARSGQLDYLILETALKSNSVLITSDRILYELALAYGIQSEYIEPKISEKPSFEVYFTEDTMSVHIIEGTKIKRKRGKPGEWYMEEINEIPDRKFVEDLIEEIITLARSRDDSFIEIERPKSIIVQLGIYRITIVEPPLSDSYEITIVRPIKKLKLEEYNLDEKILERLREKAEGIIIAGKPGSGKTTFAQALAEFYKDNKKIVKTVESPRDLILSRDIVQYSKNFSQEDELHDILLLSRPDYVIFDEMRTTKDFKLYIDLRLAGIGMVGVMHAERPIDVVHRLIYRTELGLIPHILDTIIFIENGNVTKVYYLSLKVKVPTGLTEQDLARPVVEVRDLLTGELEYEIYTFGEEIIVVPVKYYRKEGVHKLLEDMLINMFRERYGKILVDVNEDRIVFYVKRNIRRKFIRNEREFLRSMQNKYKIKIFVKSIEGLENIPYTIYYEGKYVVFDLGKIFKNKEVVFYVNGKKIGEFRTDKKGKIYIDKENETGRKIEDYINERKEIEIKIK